MAIISYQDTPADLGKQAVSQQQQVGQQAAGGLFSNTAAQSAFKKRAGYNQQTLNAAVDAWGLDLVANWNKNSEEMTNALNDDMEQMRRAATQARQANDMAMYKIAMQKIMFDKEMAAHATALTNAKIGDIFTAIIAGLGQLGAGFFTSDYWENLKTIRQPTFQTAGQYQATPQSGFTF